MTATGATAVVLRVPTGDDAPAVAAYLNEHAVALFGESELTPDEVRHWFTLPHTSFLVAERNGSMVGYVDVADERGAGARWNIDARTLDADVADMLVAAAEGLARAGSAGDADLYGFVPELDVATTRAYERHGFAHVRSSYQMRIDLTGEPPAPVWPEGVAVRTFRDGDDERVYEAQQESFADHWNFERHAKEDWRRFTVERPGWDPSLYFLAEDGDELAGIALCGWHHSGDPHFGWVNVLGVRRPWRKRGLGLALLRHAFVELALRGASRVGLGVDADNTTGAVRLYERAGMYVARRNDQYLKSL